MHISLAKRFVYNPHVHLTSFFNLSLEVSTTLNTPTGLMAKLYESEISPLADSCSVCRAQGFDCWCDSYCLEDSSVPVRFINWRSVDACLSAKEVGNHHCHGSGELQRVLLCG